MRVSPSQHDIAKAFANLKSDVSFAESRALFEQGLPIAEMLQAMALRPELLEAFSHFGKCLYPGGLLERSLKERVILKASLLNNCQFCSASHISLMQGLGISARPVEELESELNSLSRREQIAVLYTEQVTLDSNNVADSMFEELRRLFTEAEIVELTFLIGFINMLNRFNNALRITYRGDYDRRQ